MLTKIYRRFYVIIPVHFEDDGCAMVEKLIKVITAEITLN